MKCWNDCCRLFHVQGGLQRKHKWMIVGASRGGTFPAGVLSKYWGRNFRGTIPLVPMDGRVSTVGWKCFMFLSNLLFPFQLPVGARTLPTTIMYVLSHMIYVLWYASVEYLLHQRTIIVEVTLRCEWKCTHHCCLLRVVSATIAEPKVHSNPEMGVCNETLY